MDIHIAALESVLKKIKEYDYYKYMNSIYLYGSCARGTHNSSSDIDLIIFTKELLDRNTQNDIRLHISNTDYTMPEIDIKFRTGTKFSTTSKIFQSNLEDEAKLLWECDNKSYNNTEDSDDYTYFELAELEYSSLALNEQLKNYHTSQAFMISLVAANYMRYIIELSDITKEDYHIVQTVNIIRLAKYIKKNISDFKFSNDILIQAGDYNFTTYEAGKEFYIVDTEEIANSFKALSLFRDEVIKYINDLR